MAGDRPSDALNTVAGLRELPLQEFLDRLAALTGNDLHAGTEFIVAALEPTTLWRVADGLAFDRTETGDVWIGDQHAHATFRELYPRPLPVSQDTVEFRMLSAMHSLVHRVEPRPPGEQVSSVGGHVVRVATGHGGFRFVPDPVAIAPSHLVATTVRHGDRLSMTITAPAGLDPTVTQLVQLVGKHPTRGALAFWLPQAGRARLFAENRPGRGIDISASSAEEVIRAAAEHGQRLSRCGCENPDH